MSPLFSEESYIDNETVLDILVNIIPMAILLGFVILFLAVSPWGYEPGMTFVSQFLIIFPFVILGILTYLAARVIARDENTYGNEE